MLTYKNSGVDKEEGYKSVDMIKQMAVNTYSKKVLNELGSFGAMYKLGRYKNPVLVSGTDGVGTKLKLAFHLKKYDTIGTVSIGYADGVRRDLSNKGYVYYKGNKCDIIGRVCMDQLLILIPQKLSKEAKKGDTVEIFGENINVVEVADLCNTISYEILCGISQRVPRIYK